MMRAFKTPIALAALLSLPSLAEAREKASAEPPACRASEGRVVGTVAFFSESKGYGFIKLEKEGADVFVHDTELKKSGIKTLTAGDRDVSERRRTQPYGRPQARALQIAANADYHS